MYESCVEPGPPPQSICASHMICTLMEWKCFLLIYKFIMWSHFYSTVCAVNSSNYITETGSCFKLRFNVGLFNCIVGIWYTCWDADNSVPLGWHGSAQGRLAQSQLVGQLPLESPGCLNPSMHVTCGTNNAWLLAVLRSNAGRSLFEQLRFSSG